MINVDMFVDEVKKMPELNQVSDLFQGRCDGRPKDEEGKTFYDLHRMFYAWNPESMIKGVEKLIDFGKNKETFVYQIYTQDEIRANSELENVKLTAFMGNPEKPFVILCAGGGYNSVCSMAEAFPVATQLSELGYSTFCLNYRTYSGTDILFPKPVDDLAQAVKYVFEHKKMFNLCSDNYALGGFSAGANLINVFCLENIGYKKYNVKKPNCLFSVYGLMTFSDLTTEMRESIYDTMFGGNVDTDLINQYDVILNIKGDYPASYIVVAEDDDTVPVSNSLKLKEKLDLLNVPNKLEIGENGGHGFGDGRDTDLEGWVERAVLFWNSLTEE